MKKLVLLVVVAVFVVLGLCACEPVRQVDTTTTNPTPSTSETQKPTDTSSQLPSGSYETPNYVTYELNGGTQNGGNPMIYISGTSAKVYSPTKYGHVFEGWYTSPTFQGEPVTDLKYESGDITLYARWSLVVVNVKYNMGQGVEGPVNDSDNPSSYEWNPEAAPLPLFDPVANGYAFVGWYSSADLSEENKITSISRDSLTDITVYAKWEKAVSPDIKAPIAELPQHDGLKLPAGSKLLVNVDNQSGTHATMPDGSRPLLYQCVDGTGATIRFRISETDFTGYSALTFMMYNANPHGGVMIFWYLSGGSGNVYTLPLNWTGWKQITIDLSSSEWGFAGGADMTKVNDIRFQNNGWSGNLDSKNPDGSYAFNTIAYVDDIYLVGNDSPYKIDASSITSADFKAVKDKWRENLLGNASVTPASTGKSRGQTAIGLANSMNTSADRKYLWSNATDLTSEIGVQAQYEKVKSMALGWGTPGSEYYHDEALLAAIVDAFTFLYSYDVDGDGVPGVYGKNVSKSRPGNWWNWDIGTPTELVDALMIIEEAVDKEFIANVLWAVDYCCYPIGMTAANRTWIAQPAIGSIMLQEDAARVEPAIQQLLQVFDYVTSSDGFYEDGSFIQHKDLSYIHGYGSSFFGSITNELYFLEGTPFDLTIDGKKFSQIYSDKILTFFFDSAEPMIYDGYAIYGSSGRGMSAGTAKGIVANTFILTEYASEELRERFYSTLKYYEQVDPTNYGNIKGSLPYINQAYYDTYKARTDIEPRSDYYFTHIFGGMDRVVAHTQGFSAVVCMSSTRTERYEAINGAGGTGWYLGDGALFIYGSNPGGYNSGYHAGLDKLMIPGTTVSSTPRVSQQYTADTNLKNRHDFVGGASYGIYGASAMYLKYNVSDDIQGLTSDLRAQKAYFFFDNEIVCVGSGINASNTEEINVGDVYTIIGNHALNKTTTMFYEIAVNGEVIKTSNNATVYEGTDYITVEKFGGYYFPTKEDVTIKHSIATNSRYGQIYINHGSAPQDEKYAYVILPEMSAEEVAAYAANPDVVVVRAHNFVSVVREVTSNTTGYVFWYGTYAEGLRASTACVVVKVDNHDGSFTYSVSDPSQKLAVMTFTLDGEWEVEGNKVTGSSIQDGKTVVTINSNESLGASLTFTATPKN